MFTLPGGGVYYVPARRQAGGVNVGVCWYGPTNGNEYAGVPTGWLGLGYTPPPPPLHRRTTTRTPTRTAQ